MYGDQFGEFVSGYWGLKGLRSCVTKFMKIPTEGNAAELSETLK